MSQRYTNFFNYLQDTEKKVSSYILEHLEAAKIEPPVLDQSVVSYLRSGGKKLRPAVLLLACGAVGGDARKALPAAGAVELFHTWTLVHDDIIDNDDLRRGNPTVHISAAQYGRTHLGISEKQARKYGTDVAILTGDVQHGWSIVFLSEHLRKQGVHPDVVLYLITMLQTYVLRTLVYGEMLDVEFGLQQKSILDISEDDIIQMLWMKTGALYEYAGLAGAMIGKDTTDADDPEVLAIKSFCSHCGTAFQIRDDILGIVGDQKKLGKPIGSDIREGKKTLILRAALLNASEKDRQTICSTLGNQEATDLEVATVTRLLRANGGIEYAHALATRYIEKALPHLDALKPSPSKDLLEQWAQYLLERTY